MIFIFTLITQGGVYPPGKKLSGKQSKFNFIFESTIKLKIPSNKWIISCVKL